jgi:hypothetical protein
MAQNYSPAIIGPDEEYPNNEKVPSTAEFLDMLNRQDMLEFFKTVEKKSYKKAIKMVRKFVKKFIKEDPKLNLLRAFFILALFNLEDYKFIREAYQEAVKVSPGCIIKLTDVYHASMVLSDNRDYDKFIDALAPYIREIVFKIANDVKQVRLTMNNKIARC